MLLLVSISKRGYVVALLSTHATLHVYRWLPGCGLGGSRHGDLTQLACLAAQHLSVGPRSNPRSARPPLASVQPVAKFRHANLLTRAGMTIQSLYTFRAAIECPFDPEHSAGASCDGSTVLFGPLHSWRTRLI